MRNKNQEPRIKIKRMKTTHLDDNGGIASLNWFPFNRFFRYFLGS